MFGPDARSVQTSYAFDSFQLGPLIVDATKVYAGGRGAPGRGGAVRLLPLHAAPARRSAPAPTTIPARWSSGLDVKRLYALTFGLGAACVGAAGSILVLLVDVTPQLGPAYTLLAFVIVITGGLGSMPGALLGGVLIGVTEAMAGLFFTPSAKSMFSFALLVLVLLFRPQGILGKKAS